MKFLGIDIKLYGDDYSIKQLLETLIDVETNYKLYLNKDYLDKYFFVANVFSQNLYCDLSNVKNENGEMVSNSYFTIYNLNETENGALLLEQLKTNYLDIIAESDDVYTCLNH